MPASATLVLIDIQQGFDEPVWGVRNNQDAERNASKLLEAWRRTGRPVIHVKHMSRLLTSPLRPGQPGNEIKREVTPADGEAIITKSVNSAFIGTGLEDLLTQRGATTVVFVGLTTDHCVSTSARMAANLGFECYVVDDATATFERLGYDGKHYQAEEIHATSLASLNDEFAHIVKSEMLLSLL